MYSIDNIYLIFTVIIVCDRHPFIVRMVGKRAIEKRPAASFNLKIWCARVGESHYFPILRRFDVQNSVLRCRQVGRHWWGKNGHPGRRRDNKKISLCGSGGRSIWNSRRKFYQVFDLLEEAWDSGWTRRCDRGLRRVVSRMQLFHCKILESHRFTEPSLRAAGKHDELLSSILARPRISYH